MIEIREYIDAGEGLPEFYVGMEYIDKSGERKRVLKITRRLFDQRWVQIEVDGVSPDLASQGLNGVADQSVVGQPVADP